jgi:hypothetical protein
VVGCSYRSQNGSEGGRVWGGDDVLFVHGIFVRMGLFVLELDIEACIMYGKAGEGSVMKGSEAGSDSVLFLNTK